MQPVKILNYKRMKRYADPSAERQDLIGMDATRRISTNEISRTAARVPPKKCRPLKRGLIIYSLLGARLDQRRGRDPRTFAKTFLNRVSLSPNIIH